MNVKLAEAAWKEAQKNYHGDTDAAMGNLQPLAELFEMAENVTLDTLNTDWSGAFAFLCAEKAGLGMPIRYPDPRVHATFASVEAWVEYARLPKIRLWLTPDHTPEVGDLAVFDTPVGAPAMMGIVLELHEDNTMDVAIGNYHNHSAVAERPCDRGIRGFIRMEGSERS